MPWIGWDTFAMPATTWLTERLGGALPALLSDHALTHVSLAKSGVGAALLPHLTVHHYGLAPLPPTDRLRKELGPWPIVELFTKLLDGRNASTTSHVEEVLGIKPRDLAEWAHATAATGVWSEARAS